MRIELFAISLFLSVLVLASDAAAVPCPTGRTMTGVVEFVDAENQMITIIPDCPDALDGRLAVKWGSLTRGFMDGRDVSFDELRPGTHVRIRYVSPLFGPKVLRRIGLNDSGDGLRGAAPECIQGRSS